MELSEDSFYTWIEELNNLNDANEEGKSLSIHEELPEDQYSPLKTINSFYKLYHLIILQYF